MTETMRDPLDRVVAELMDGMTSAELDQFRELDQTALKIAMRQSGMDRLPDATEDFDRCSGNVVCGKCGQAYFAHPMDWRLIGYGNAPFLNVLCDGRRVKL